MPGCFSFVIPCGCFQCAGHIPMLVFGLCTGMGVGAYNSRHMVDCFTDTCILTKQQSVAAKDAVVKHGGPMVKKASDRAMKHIEDVKKNLRKN
mmetsp:Transcript_19937/g.34202  ORF Transcript_19937/g.34202 Transcript_19937/m.34202 type:complete len:93 (-) Transcript_19937:121-399(-)